MVKEPSRTNNRGRRRIAKRWVLVALALIARVEGIAWRKLGEKLVLCKFLIEEGWMIKILSKYTFHDSKVFGVLWQKLPSTLLRPSLRFYADSAYWTENIVGLLKQHGLIPIIRPKSNACYLGSPPLGPIVQAHRLYPGLYRHNHHPEYCSSVEHVFGLLKLSLHPILDRLPSCVLNTLYSPLICYNYLLLLQTV